jgi:hypothetical protein
MKVRSAERGAKLLMDFREKGGIGKEKEKEKEKKKKKDKEKEMGVKMGTPSSVDMGGSREGVVKEGDKKTIMSPTTSSPGVPVIRINLFD